MNFSRSTERVTIEMSHDEFNRLLLILSYAAGAAKNDEDPKQFYRVLAFSNALNVENLNWKPYDIPLEYRDEQ